MGDVQPVVTNVLDGQGYLPREKVRDVRLFFWGWVEVMQRRSDELWRLKSCLWRLDLAAVRHRGVFPLGLTNVTHG